jgi:non-ribosomal peptide synthetase component F
VTAFTTLLAAFKVWLYGYTGQTDIIVGTPIANRDWPEVESLIGCFVNMLVLRTDLANDPPLRHLLGQVQETFLDAYVHRALPFQKLVQVLHPKREKGHSPVFQVMFVFQQAANKTLDLPGLRTVPIELDIGVTHFDLTLTVEEEGLGMTAGIEYDVNLFGEATVEQMLKNYHVLLQCIVTDPDQKLSGLLSSLPMGKRDFATVSPQSQSDEKSFDDLREQAVSRRATLADRRSKLPDAERALLEELLGGA